MSQPLLEARGVVKRFGHVHALRGAGFTAHAGEVVALIGDNGAGKSTLVKILSGAAQPDAGEILLSGRPVRLDNPVAAQRLGLETVYQDLALAHDLDAAANLFLGRELTRAGPLRLLDKPAMRRRAVESFRELGVRLPDVSAPVRRLSGGQRQCVAVARAVVWASKVVFMDEPTAALGVLQRRQVLDLIRRVRDRGVTVVLISHNMPEVLAVADRVEVLRLGRRVAALPAAGTSVEELVSAMTGGLDQAAPGDPYDGNGPPARTTAGGRDDTLGDRGGPRGRSGGDGGGAGDHGAPGHPGPGAPGPLAGGGPAGGEEGGDQDAPDTPDSAEEAGGPGGRDGRRRRRGGRGSRRPEDDGGGPE